MCDSDKGWSPIMTQQTRWQATVRFAHDATKITEDQLDTLMAELPGYGIAAVSLTWMDVDLTVDASTLRQATETALRLARSAYDTAFGHASDPTRIAVLAEADHLAELARPKQEELAGIAEVAELLGVSKQRAGEVARTHPDFPEAIANLAAGPVYTRASIEAFEKRWERKRTGRPRAV